MSIKLDKLKPPTSIFIFWWKEGGGGGEGRGVGVQFLQTDLLGYDFGRYLRFYDNATLNPHEYFKVAVQAYCGNIDCYDNLCELI